MQTYQFNVTADNENDAKTGVPDGDFNTRQDYPAAGRIEFNVIADYIGKPTAATLTILANDVDPAGTTPAEQDVVYVNGKLAGYLTIASGDNNVDSTTVLTINPAWLTVGKNLVEIYNVNAAADGGYGFTVKSASMSLTTDPTAVESRVNSLTPGDQTFATAASFADGSYVVAFKATATDSAGDPGGIYFQRYDTAGRPVRADGVTAGTLQTAVNTTIAGLQDYPKVTTLANGKFVVTWTDRNGADGSGEGIYAQLFAADGTKIGAENRVNATTSGRQTQSTPIAMGDGGYLIAWASDTGSDGNDYGTYGQRFNASGEYVTFAGVANGSVRAETLLNTSTVGEQGWTSAVAMTGGKFMVIYGGSAVGSVDRDVHAKIFNANGTVAVPEFRLNTYQTSDQYFPHAALLANGDIAVTWMSYQQDGSGQGLFGRVVRADGTFAGAEFQINSYTAGDQPNYEDYAGARLVGTADGGFVVTWHAYQDLDSRAILYQQFDAVGRRVGPEVQANRSEGGDQSFADVVATSDGFTLIWNSQTAVGDTSGYGVVSRAFNLEGAPIVATGGENLVNGVPTPTQSSPGFGDQERPEVVSAADGRHVVVWQTKSALGVGDGSGRAVMAQVYGADGLAVGLQFQVNTTTANDQFAPHIAWLDGANSGRFVVTWTSYAQNVNQTGSYARVFNADGTAATAEFAVFPPAQNGVPNGNPSVSALHGDNAGGFVISWNDTNTALFAQRYDAALARAGSLVSVAGNGQVSQDVPGNAANVTGLADGGFVVDWTNNANYYAGVDMLARRFDKTGVAVASVNADGTAAPATGPFIVNSSPPTVTHFANDHGATALQGGGWVMTWQAGNFQDGYEWGLYGQIYNADGSLRGGEFRVNAAAYGSQVNAQVTALSDGSFVVVFYSSQTDNFEGSEIYAKRFSSTGVVLNNEFIVNTGNTDGNARWPSVTATPTGFIVAWQDQQDDYGPYSTRGADGSGNAILKKAFTVDGLNATADTAHTPSLTALAATGHETVAYAGVTNGIALNVTAALATNALGTESLSVEVSDIPVGSVLTDGAGGHSFTATAGRTATSVTGWTLSSLKIAPPVGDETPFTLGLRVTSRDSATGDFATVATTLPVTVTGLAEAQALDGPSTRVNSFTAGDQVTFFGSDRPDRHSIATWNDGGYVVVWTSNLQDGSGWGVYAQRYNASGVPVGSELAVNTFTPGEQTQPSVATLSDGRFVVTWTSYAQTVTTLSPDPLYSFHDVFARTFDVNNVGSAEVRVNATSAGYQEQYHPDVTRLNDGGYIITWSANYEAPDNDYGVYAQRFNASGVKVDRNGTTASTGTSGEFRLNTTTANQQSWSTIAATADGGFVAVWNSNYQEGAANGSSFGIFGQRFNASGAAVGTEFKVNTTVAGEQFHPVIAAIAGGFVVAWEDASGTDGDGYGVFAQIYNADGSARGGQFMASGRYIGGGQFAPALVATPSGGFIVAFSSDYEDFSSYAVLGQEFDAQGHRVGDSFLLDQGRQLDQQRYVSLAQTTEGFVATWQSYGSGGTAAESGDAADTGWGVFAKRFATRAHTEIAVGGENQVATTSLHEQQNAASTTLTNGDYIITWQSKPAPSSAATHDLSDWGVYAQRFNASGQKVAFDGSALASGATGQVLINGARTDYEQAEPAITALDGGGFVVVWHSQVGDTSGYGVFGQRYSEAGAKVGATFQVNVSVNGNQYTPQVTALHGANAGGFVVAWYDEGNGADVRGRVYDASGVAVGATDITLNAQNPTLNGNNYAEYNVQLAGLNNGGFVAVWRDQDSDGNGEGVFGQRYGVDLTARTVTAATATQPDGTTTTGNFRVNTTTLASQYDPDIVTLNDGKFVVVWVSDDSGRKQDGSGAGILAQVYSAAGARIGGEFVVNTTTNSTQDQPQVAALADGGFAVAWRSYSVLSNTTEIFARRYSAAGTAVDDAFLVNTGVIGAQDDPTLTKTANGFVVAWTTDRDGSGDTGVLQQRYVFDPGPGAGQVADLPTLTTVNTTGAQNTAVALNITATLNDTTPANPETLRLEIRAVPVGATVADGAGGHTFTATAGNTAVDVAGWTLPSLSFTAPTGKSGTYVLDVRATSTEPSGDMASTATPVSVTVTPVTPPQAPFGVEFVVDSATADSTPAPKIASFADGSFVMVWDKLNFNVGHAWDLAARIYNADGTPKGDAFIVNPVGAGSDYQVGYASVDVLSDGTFVVAYGGLYGTGGDSWEIKAQRFSAMGAKLNPDGTSTGTPGPLLLSTGTDGAGANAHINTQIEPVITALAGGGYVVSWSSYDQETARVPAAPPTGGFDDTYGIYAKRIGANGAVVQMKDDNGTLADVIHVSNATVGDQHYSSVTQLAGGKIVFGYSSPDTSGDGVFVRVYDLVSGFGPEFQANSFVTGVQSGFYAGDTITALANGNFVVTWSSEGQDGSNYGVWARVLKPDLTFDRGPFQVNSYTYDHQFEPQVDSLADGGFMITWSSGSQDGSSYGVYAQRYTAAGDRIGTEFRLNDTLSNEQGSPTVVVQGDGSGVIFAWEDNSVGNKVVAKRIALTDAAQQAAVEAVGSETQVNTTTAGDQSQAAITKLPDGSYIVAWHSSDQDGSSYGVYARHYDAAGAVIPWAGGATELRLNSGTTNEQSWVAIVGLKDGSFVASWDSYFQPGDSGMGVYARQFEADGTPRAMLDAAGTATTNDLRIATTTAGEQRFSQLTGLNSAGAGTINGVAVTWQSPDVDGAGVYTKQLQVVATGADAGKLQLQAGADTLVNSLTQGNQSGQQIATLADGKYVIVWQADGAADGNSSGVYGQLFNANGTRSAEQFLINSYNAGPQDAPSVAGLTYGGFVVVYESSGFDGSADGIAGQRFDNAAQPVGAEFQVNAIAANAQYNPAVTAAQDGGFIVSWQSQTVDQESTGVVVRRFDLNGVATDPQGNDVFVNTYGAGEQGYPAVVALQRGFVVAWQSAGQDGSSSAVEMQRFQGQGLQPPPIVVNQGGVSNGVNVFTTIQDAINAASSSDVIEIVGGATAATAVVFNEALVTAGKNNLQVQNRAGTFVVINGTTDNAALTVESGKSITLVGDAANRLVFNPGVGGDAGVDLLGANGGTVIKRVTVNAVTAGEALSIGGAQNGVVVESSVFGGATTQALVNVRPTTGGGAASTNVSFVNNTFNITGGQGLIHTANGSQITGNLFAGASSPSGTDLQLVLAGPDVRDNTFTATGGRFITDPGSLFSEGTLINLNSFPNGYVWNPSRNDVNSTVAQSVATAQAGETILISTGNFSTGSPVTVAVNNLTFNGPVGATGIALVLSGTATQLNLTGDAPINVTGNNLGDLINGNNGVNTLTGGAGADTLNGGGGIDTLNGGAGADTLNGGTGNDILDGGGDGDTYVYNRFDGLDVITDTGASGSDRLQLNMGAGFDDQVVISASAGSVRVDRLGDAGTEITAGGIEAIEVSIDSSDSVQITSALPGVASVRVDGSGSGGTKTVDLGGFAGAGTILGGSGADTITGGDGMDVITGGQGADVINGGTNADTINYAAETGAGDVIVNLSTTGLTVGGTTVAAGHARDSFGNDDTLNAIENVATGGGADTVRGSAGANAISTGAGADSVDGGAGNDEIAGGAGNDALTGGTGSDGFGFDTGFGQDAISDFSGGGANGTGFDADTDVLRFAPTVFATREAALAAATTSGANVVITAAGGNTITLQNIALSKLSLANFDIVGVNDAPTLRTAAVSNGLVEAGGDANGTTGTATATVLLKLNDVDGLATFDPTALLAANWTQSGATWTKPGGFGSAALNTTTGLVTYTLDNARTATQALNAGQAATDAFTLPAIDNTGATTSASVSFAITGANDIPTVAANLRYNATEAGAGVAGSNATGNLLSTAADVDAGNTFSVNSVSNPGGTAAAGASLLTAYGSLTVAANGALTYVVNQGAVDSLRATDTITDNFTFLFSDNFGGQRSAGFGVVIQGVNDAPVAVANAVAVLENATATTTTRPNGVLGNDSDVDLGETATLTVSAVRAGAGAGTNTVVPATGGAAASVTGVYGTLSLKADGSYSYSPSNAAAEALNLNASAADTFTYTIVDVNQVAATATLTFNITGQNDLPTVTGEVVSATENVLVQASTRSTGLLANDTDIDTGETAALRITGAHAGLSGADTAVPSSGSQTIQGTYGALLLAADGTYSYTAGTAAANALAVGQSATDTFTYTVADGQGGSRTTTATFNVAGVNDTPTPSADTAAVNEDALASANGRAAGVLGNDIDVDSGETSSLRVSGVRAGIAAGANTSVPTGGAFVSVTGTYGTLNIKVDGSYSYTPNTMTAQALAAGQTASDVFTYAVADVQAGAASSTLTFNITGVNDGPTAANDAAAATQRVAKTGNVLANDSDIDQGDALSVDAGTLTGTNGVLTLGGNGAYSYISTIEGLAVGQQVSDTFSYTMRDGRGGVATAQLAVTVTGSGEGNEGANILIGTAGNDTLHGFGGADTLTGGAGSDTIDGGDGIDTAFYAGLSRGYGLSLNGGAGTVSGGDEGGTDTLSGIETVRFFDGSVTFDPSSAAAQIARIYGVLGRAVDDGALAGWQTAMRAGATLKDLAGSLLASGEFSNASGGGASLSNGQYVTYLYQTLLQRTPDQGGYNNYVSFLDNGGSRADAMVFLSESGERKTLTATALAQGLWVQDDTAEALSLLFDAAFNRGVDPGGLASFGTLLGSGGTVRDVLNVMVGSAEFAAIYGGTSDTVFVQQLYRTALNREADSSGLANFVDELAHGVGRAEVVLQIAASAEHQALVLSHTDYDLIREAGPKTVVGGAGADTLTGGALGDLLIGLGGDDVLRGLQGSDTLNGGDGIDTAFYAGLSRGYGLSLNGGAGTVSGGDEGGTDTLSGIETVRFFDGSVTFDPSSAAAQIARIYGVLGRAVDDGALAGWQTAMRAGATLKDLAGSLLASGEFSNASGGGASLSNGQYVTYLYQTLLQRTPDQGGYNNYVSFLDNGGSRADAMVFLSESGERKTLTATALAQGLWVQDDTAEALSLLFDAAFNRGVDPGGLASFGTLLGSGGTVRDVLNVMVGSAEFAAIYGGTSDTVFVQQLYRTALNREADSSGLANFVDELAHGVGRAEVVLQIAASAEHQALVLSHTDYDLVREAGPKRVVGGAGADTLTGGALGDLLIGLGGDDVLRGLQGSDTLNGGDGIDTAFYAGLSRGYGLSLNGGAGTVSGGDEGGTDTLSGIETVRFFDGSVTFDPSSAAAQIARIYGVLGRAVDDGALANWQTAFKAGATLKDVANALLGSGEFSSAAGSNLSNGQYVTYLYQSLLQRTPDQGGYNNYVSFLDNGGSRADAMVFLSESGERKTLTAGALAQGLWAGDDNAGGLAALFDAAYGHRIDDASFASYMDQLSHGATLRDVAHAMATTSEFVTRYAADTPEQFVDELYLTAFHRAADQGGRNNFVNQLNNGASRADVMYAFAAAPEHQQLIFSHTDYVLLYG